MDYQINRGALITTVLLAFPLAVSAAENRGTVIADGFPSLELLEFLGSFETDSGEWVNPGELLQPDFEQLLQQVENTPTQTSGIDQDNESSTSEEAENEDEI